ncbi:MAG: hypothetical protein FJ279_31220 [Planctomycetes bacterium]|nr:hypothetical protein [Planctomycetota bacterium]
MNPARMKRIKEVLERWGGLEPDQLSSGEDAEKLAQRRYLAVEHGRDGSRRWFTAFKRLDQLLAFAVGRAYEDEWAFTAAYDLDTGEELEVRFHADVVRRAPPRVPDRPILAGEASAAPHREGDTTPP